MKNPYKSWSKKQLEDELFGLRAVYNDLFWKRVEDGEEDGKNGVDTKDMEVLDWKIEMVKKALWKHDPEKYCVTFWTRKRGESSEYENDEKYWCEECKGVFGHEQILTTVKDSGELSKLTETITCGVHEGLVAEGTVEEIYGIRW